MFSFFRAYQKILFIIITAIIVITFSFFGTYSTIDHSSKHRKKDKVVATINGKKIKVSEIDELSYFLSREADLAMKLNCDLGTIKKDFFQTKLATMLYNSYFEKFKEEYAQKLLKVQTFTPYTHPQATFISAIEVWNKFNPDLVNKLENLQAKSSFDSEAFELFSDLYLLQCKFSPEMLKRILLYHQSYYQWIKPDNRLMNDDMALFGFNSLSDWVGQGFIDLVSQFILSSAAIAEEKGNKVTLDEAREDFNKNVILPLLNNNKYSKEDFQRYKNSLFEMKENDLIKIWQRVLLFRKYVNEVANSIFLDTLCEDEISAFNKEKNNILLFELPQELRLKSFEDFLKIQIYLKAVLDSKDPLTANSKVKSIDAIEKKYPELIEKRFSLKVKHVNIKDLGLSIGEKALWVWQLKDENWSILKKEFIQLRSFDDSQEKRFQYLESLSKDVRNDVDQFSRKKMIIENFDQINLALENAQENGLDVGIKMRSKVSFLTGVSEENILPLLEKLSLDQSLSCYSDNKEDFYTIKVSSCNKEKNIVTLKDALSEKILDSLLDRALLEKYDSLSEDEMAQFKDKNGGKKSFSSIKDEIGALVFKDLLRKIDAKKGKVDFGKGLDSYAKYFMYFYLQDIKNKLEKDQLSENSLDDQIFKLERKNLSITRLSPDEVLKDAIFSKNKNIWSDLLYKDGIPFFYKFLNKESDEKKTYEDGFKLKSILSQDAKKEHAQKILNELIAKDLINFPLER